MADNKMPIPTGGKVDGQRLTGLKKRQQIEMAGRNMFAWVVVAAVAVSFCVATGQYLFSRWQYNNKILSAKFKANDTLVQNITNAKQLKQEVDSLIANANLALVKTDPDDSNLKSILDALPTAADPAALATSLQQAILSRSGVTIESITMPPETDQPQGTVIAATPQEIRFSFVVSGTFSKVHAMIKDLERSIRPIKITGLNLNGTDTNLRANVEATTYYQPSKTVNATTEVVK